MIKTKLTINSEKEILKRLDRIENLLIQVIPQKTELTEEQLLKIIKKGDQEYQEGKTEEFDHFIARCYPHLIKR